MCDFNGFINDFCLSSIDGSWAGLALEGYLAFLALQGLVASSDPFCDSMEAVCKRWKISEDAAGATLLAIGNGIPEITVNIVTSLETLANPAAAQSSETNTATLGIGATLGSGLIAFLVIPAACGFCTDQAKNPVLVASGPTLRETGFYALSLAVLAICLLRGASIQNSGVLLGLYVVYVVIILYAKRIMGCFSGKNGAHQESLLENGDEEQGDDDDEDDEDKGPVGKVIDTLSAPMVWPVENSIPSCKIDTEGESRYPLTLLMGSFWLTFLSYLVTLIVQRWVSMLNSGEAMRIFGVILVGVAAQVPDTVNAMTCSRRGLGSMAMSGALGSQVVNVCIGFGLPWLAAALVHQPVQLSASEGIFEQIYTQIAVCILFLVILLGPAILKPSVKANMTKSKAAVFALMYFGIIVGSSVVFK